MALRVRFYLIQACMVLGFFLCRLGFGLLMPNLVLILALLVQVWDNNNTVVATGFRLCLYVCFWQFCRTGLWGWFGFCMMQVLSHLFHLSMM